jgi:hypothetical protein
MSNTALWEVQKAVVASMTASSTLTTLVSSKIYDEPPTDTDYPYIVVGNPTETDDNTLQKLGFNNTITCFIYTRPYGLGWYPATQILDAMNAVLNAKRPTLTNLNIIHCKNDNVMHEVDGDKRILHVRYRLFSQKKTNHSY